MNHLKDVKHLKNVEHLKDVENLKDVDCRAFKGCRAHKGCRTSKRCRASKINNISHDLDMIWSHSSNQDSNQVTSHILKSFKEQSVKKMNSYSVIRLFLYLIHLLP